MATVMDEMITRIRHIGIIVDDIAGAIEPFKKLLDLKDEDIYIIPPLGTEAESRFAFIPVGNIELELIQPISDRFKKFTGYQPEGLNHIAYVVKDIEEAVRHLQEKGIRLGHVTRNGILDMGRSRVAYFAPETTGGMLIELVEPKE
jgi:catechol 2,3-dioxygenase-like lactoylglutathione lyase family enzyme